MLSWDVVTYKSNKNVTKGENDYAVATISASKDGNFVFEPVYNAEELE